MKKILPALFAALLCLCSCGIYSFTGTSIQPDIKSIEISNFEYKALKVNPTLSNDLTEAIRTRFRRMTKLEQVDSDADLELKGEISGYDVSTSSVSASEVAAQNRLTISIKMDFVNNKYPEDNVSKSFSQYADFDAALDLTSVESQLCAEIIDKLVEDIFNASVAQW